jgi:predicted RNase H-like HicB family nuclease
MIRHPLLPVLSFKLLKDKVESHFNKWIHIYRGKDGNWIAKCDSLPGCISQGKTRKEAIAHIEEAIAGYLAALEEDNLPVPKKGRNRTKPALTIQLKISTRMCVKALSKEGFYFKKMAGENGSRNIILRRDKPHSQLVVPACRRLDREILALIIKTSGLTLNEFMKLL